jgi:hypothetical protein
VNPIERLNAIVAAARAECDRAHAQPITSAEDAKRVIRECQEARRAFRAALDELNAECASW